MTIGLGNLVAFWSTAIGGAIDRLIEAFVRETAAAMWVALVAWLIFSAIRFYTGDVEGEAKALFKRSLAMTFIVSFATSAPLITKFIKEFYWVTMPGWISRTAASAGLGDQNTVTQAQLGWNVPSNLGDDLDVIFAHVWRSVAVVWGALKPWDIFGYGSCIVTVLSGIAQVGIAIVAYVVSDFLTGALVGMAAPFIACALFDYTRPIFDRYLGKLISLVLVKGVVVVITAMVIQSDLIFLDMIRNASPTVGVGEGILQQVRVMLWVVIVMCVGLLITASSAYLAYSLGGGGGGAPAIMPSLPGGGKKGGGGKGGGGGGKGGGGGASSGGGGGGGITGSIGRGIASVTGRGNGGGGRGSSSNGAAPAPSKPTPLGGSASPNRPYGPE